MFHLKRVPKFARLLSAPPVPQKLSSLECSHFRWLATISLGGRRRGGEEASRGGRNERVRGSGNRKNDDFNISSKQKQGASNEQFMEGFVRYDENQGAQRAYNREVRGQLPFGGPPTRGGLAGPANSGQRNSAGHSSRSVRGLNHSEWADNDDEVEGCRKRQFIGHREVDERIDELDNIDQGRRRNRDDSSVAKGQAVLSFSDRGDPCTEDETDEEELKAISTMDNEEFEKHLRQKENANASKREHMVRLDARGEKTFDKGGQKVADVRSATSSKKETAERWKQEQTLKKLPKEYNVCKARVHSILWECEKRKLGLDEKLSEETDGGDYMDTLNFDSDGEVCPPLHSANGIRDTSYNTQRDLKIEPKHWEGSVQPESMEGASAMEETMLLEEFERRIEYNRLQVAAFVKQHLYSRRRPVEGWNYIVDKFGLEGKIGKLDGKHGKLNDFEKSSSKRESIRPLQKIL